MPICRRVTKVSLTVHNFAACNSPGAQQRARYGFTAARHRHTSRIKTDFLNDTLPALFSRCAKKRKRVIDYAPVKQQKPSPPFCHSDGWFCFAGC